MKLNCYTPVIINNKLAISYTKQTNAAKLVVELVSTYDSQGNEDIYATQEIDVSQQNLSETKTYDIELDIVGNPLGLPALLVPELLLTDYGEQLQPGQSTTVNKFPVVVTNTNDYEVQLAIEFDYTNSCGIRLTRNVTVPAGSALIIANPPVTDKTKDYIAATGGGRVTITNNSDLSIYVQEYGHTFSTPLIHKLRIREVDSNNNELDRLELPVIIIRFDIESNIPTVSIDTLDMEVERP